MKLFYFISKNRSSLQGMLMASLLLLFLSSPQTVFTVQSGYEVEPRVDAVKFLTSRSGYREKTFLEIFCQIPTNNLQFVKFKDGFYASYKLSITLHDSSEYQVEELSIIDSVKVKTFKDIDRPRPPQLIHFGSLVEPGLYSSN